jgi:hypothetical protein
VKNLKTCFIVDEEYLTAYWSVKPKGTGWTFTVSGDLELQKYMQQFFKEPLIRYVIATYDYGVEIISDTIPKIERMGHAP